MFELRPSNFEFRAALIARALQTAVPENRKSKIDPRSTINDNPHMSTVLAATLVTLLHFSDYHSHALPFYSEDHLEQGGIARAVRYLRTQKKHGALVFSGGDMINKGSPSWSDKYECAEWPWLNGIVDAMAFGNHDADYGREQYERCAKPVPYP